MMNNIEMFSKEEYMMFGIVFCLFIAVVLMLYLVWNFVQSLITDRIYYYHKHKAIKELKKCLREIHRSEQEDYVPVKKPVYHLRKIVIFSED